ncbi:MAG: hypothetical protein ACLR56_12670 [Oscillospiraceae bacterium]
MHTKADGSDTGFFIEGGIWQHLEQFGDLDVTFDDFHIAPADTIECETLKTSAELRKLLIRPRWCIMKLFITSISAASNSSL